MKRLTKATCTSGEANRASAVEAVGGSDALGIVETGVPQGADVHLTLTVLAWNIGTTYRVAN